MSPEGSDAPVGTQAAPQRSQNRLRLAVIDRDPGFMQVLSNRLDTLGWDHRTLTSAVTSEALVAMRLNALVVDLAVLGPGGWEYLERVCARLPGLAVIVCTGPSSVAQRVRGLRLGADAWVTKPCHAEELICIVEAAIRRHRRQDMPELEEPQPASAANSAAAASREASRKGTWTRTRRPVIVGLRAYRPNAAARAPCLAANCM